MAFCFSNQSDTEEKKKRKKSTWRKKGKKKKNQKKKRKEKRAMLVLFETPAGYALIKVKNEGKLSDADNLYKEFETPEKANKMYFTITLFYSLFYTFL